MSYEISLKEAKEKNRKKGMHDPYRHLRAISSISDLRKSSTIGALSFGIINHREKYYWYVLLHHIFFHGLFEEQLLVYCINRVNIRFF